MVKIYCDLTFHLNLNMQSVEIENPLQSLENKEQLLHICIHMNFSEETTF